MSDTYINHATKGDELLAATFNHSPAGSTRARFKNIVPLTTGIPIVENLSMENGDLGNYFDDSLVNDEDGYTTESANADTACAEEIKRVADSVREVECTFLEAYWDSESSKRNQEHPHMCLQ